jgi:predicted ribosome-associated RNA-binding protein Tma20
VNNVTQFIEIQKQAQKVQDLLMAKQREDLLKQYQQKQQQQQLSKSQQSSAQASEDDDDIVILDGAPQFEVKTCRLSFATHHNPHIINKKYILDLVFQ